MIERRRALVVFEHRHAVGPLRLLAHGFRHCFCLLREDRGWLLCDPLKGSLVLRLLPDYPPDALCLHFLDTHRHVALGFAAEGGSADAGWARPYTCVELVKRAIGFNARFAITPRQLFERLGAHRDWVVDHARKGA